MPLFGRKEDVKEEIQDIEKAIEETVEALPKFEEKPIKKIIQEPERPAFAPLFVKLDRYNKILSSLSELKTTLVAIKNAFVLLNEVERLRQESLMVIENAIQSIDKKLIALDSEFLKPASYRGEAPVEIHTTEGLEGSLTDLRSRIEKLKSELQSIT